MAGAGFKTFATGEVLTAANVNTYLMQQTVMVFDDSSARSTALGANVSEGMLSYLKDTNKVEVYDGSSWVASDDPNAIQNTIVDAKGDLISATAADTPARLASSGVNGQVLTIDTSTSTGLKWATPASGTLTWTNRQNAQVNKQFRSIAYNGTNLYIAAGDGGNLYSSPDGQTWTSRTSGFGSNDIYRVIYANSIWVAVGQNGTITTSTDGTTWTARTSNMSTNTIRDIHFAASNFVAVGAGGGATNTGGITYSTDGITWTRKSQTPTVGTTYFAVTHNGTNFIVGANNSTNNFLYASTPSGTWTAAAWGGGASSGTIQRLFYDGTRTIYYDGAYIGFSTSTTIASSTVFDNVATPNSDNLLAYYNNEIHQISVGGYYYKWSTTPATFTGAVTNRSTPSLTVFGLSSISTLDGTIFAGAVGVILGTRYNEIYTSF